MNLLHCFILAHCEFEFDTPVVKPLGICTELCKMAVNHTEYYRFVDGHAGLSRTIQNIGRLEN